LFFRTLLFEKIITQEILFYDENTAGDLNTRITENVDLIQIAIGHKFQDALCQSTRGLSCLLIAISLAWRFSIVFLALVPVTTLFTALTVKIAKKYTIKELLAYGKSGTIAQQALSSLQTVISLGIEENEIKKYNENLVYAERMTIKKGLYSGLLSAISTFFSNCMYAVAIYYGIYLTTISCDFTPGLDHDFVFLVLKNKTQLFLVFKVSLCNHISLCSTLRL
jgi:ATP-binding cassette subfamily B (MDR/TAP) protein 1